MTLEQEINQLLVVGIIDSVNCRNDLTEENFPQLVGRGTSFPASLSELSLSPVSWIYCGDALDAIKLHGCLSGSMIDLIRYARRWDRLTPVIALGSIWRERPGNYYAGCLNVTDQGRELTLRDVDYGFNEKDRFLVMQK